MQAIQDTLPLFDPLLGVGDKWDDELPLLRVRETKERLQLAQSGEIDSIHHTIQSEFPTVVAQYRSALDVQQRLAGTRSAVERLQDGMQEIESTTTPLLHLLATRTHVLADLQKTSKELSTLRSLGSKVKEVQDAEKEVRTGMADVGGLVRLLQPRSPPQQEQQDDQNQKRQTLDDDDDDILQSTLIHQILDSRRALISQTTKAQLEDGFARAFAFADDVPPRSSGAGKVDAGMGGAGEAEGWELDDDDEDEVVERNGSGKEGKVLARIELAEEIQLRVVTLNPASSQPPQKQTPTQTPSNTPRAPSHEVHTSPVPTQKLMTSLHTLGMLQPLLSAFHTRLIKHVVRPLVESYAPTGSGEGTLSGGIGAPGQQDRKEAGRLGVRCTLVPPAPTPTGTETGRGKRVVELFVVDESRWERAREGEGKREREEEGLWSSLAVLFHALRDSFSSGSADPLTLTPTPTSAPLASFHKNLVSETLHIVLDSFLLRAIPVPLKVSTSFSGDTTAARTGTTTELRRLEQGKNGEEDTETIKAQAVLGSLNRWVRILHRAQEFEGTLVAATVDTTDSSLPAHAASPRQQHHVSVIRDFVETRAGAVFAAGRKQYVLGEVRGLVLPSHPTEPASRGNGYGVAADADGRMGGWGGWLSRVVVRERPGQVQTAVPPVSPPRSTTVPKSEEMGNDAQLDRVPFAERAEEEQGSLGQDRQGETEGDGWGFQDVIDLTKDEEADRVGEEKQKHDDDAMEEADGWGFDEEEDLGRQTDTAATTTAADPLSTTQTPLPALPIAQKETQTQTEKEPTITAPKPIRQARKIGKKGKSVNTSAAVASSDGGSTAGTPRLAASPSVDDSAEGVRFAGSPAFGMGTDAIRTDAAMQTMDGSVPRPAAAASEADQGDDGWNMEWEAEAQAPVPAAQTEQVQRGPTVVREQLRVSVVLDAVVQIIKNEMTFIAALQTNEISLPSFHSLPVSLASIPSETLELVRALVPVLYEAQIRDVPALAMQFANDCSWLAESVRQMLGEIKNQGMLGAVVDALSRQADKLVSLSTIVFDKQMEVQLEAIMDTLIDLEGLETTSDDRKFQACTKAFQDVEHKLETLFRVYRDVMPESTCLESMGRLIDAAISQICTDILAVVDITAEESERLKQLCQILRPIEERFNEMNVNIVAFVPHWLRFCYLAEIMEASLVDITYLLESGALVDFTSDELVHLLLALFTDTPNRAELINKVISRTQT